MTPASGASRKKVLHGGDGHHHDDDDGKSVASSKSFFSKTSAKMFSSKKKKRRDKLSKKSRRALGIERSPMEEAVTAPLSSSSCYGAASAVVDEEENASIAASKASRESRASRASRASTTYQESTSPKISKLEKIQQLTAQNSVLKSHERRLRSQVDTLAEQITKLRKTSALSVSTLEIQLDETKSQLKESKRRVRSLRDADDEDEEHRKAAVHALKEATQTQEARIRHLRGDLDRRRKQARDKDSRLADAEAELHGARKARLRLEKEMESARSEIEGLQRELTTALDLNEEGEEERYAHERERRALQGRIADYQRRLERRRELESRNMDLFAQASFRSSRRRLIATESDNGKDDDDENAAAVADLEKDLEELQARLAEKIERVTELELALDDAKESAAEEKRAREEEAEAALKKAEEETRRLRDELAATEAVSAKRKDDLARATEEARNSRLDSEGLNERIGWLMESGDRARKDLETAREDLANTQAKVEEMEERERIRAEQEQEEKENVKEKEKERIRMEQERIRMEEEQRLERERIEKEEQEQEQERVAMEEEKKREEESKTLPQSTSPPSSTIPSPDVPGLVREKEDLQKKVDMLQNLAKKAMDNVQNLEQEKKEADGYAKTLERKLHDATHNHHHDDESSVATNSSVSILNSFRFDDDDIFENARHGRRPPHHARGNSGTAGVGLGALFRRSQTAADAPNDDDSRATATANAEDRVVSVSEEEVAYKEEKIQTLQYAKKRHEQTIGALVKEVLELRKSQKASQLQIDNLRSEREAFELKVAVLEKEFAVAESNRAESASLDVSAKFAALSRRGGTAADAEVRAVFELRAKEAKVEQLERIISEDKATIAALRKETAETKAETEKRLRQQNDVVDRLRKENIRFFQRLKRAERETSDETSGGVDYNPATILEEDEDEAEDDNEDGSREDADVRAKDRELKTRELRDRLRTRERKMMALQRYNEMMERTVTSLRSELVETRMAHRTETDQKRTETERLEAELESQRDKIVALETQFNEVNRRRDATTEEPREEGEDADHATADASIAEDLRARLDQSRDELRVLRSKLEAKTASADKMIESLKRDASKLVEERGSLELDMMRQLARLDEAKHRVDALAKDLDETKSRLDSVEEEKALLEEDFHKRLGAKNAALALAQETVLKLREANLTKHETMLRRKNRRQKKRRDRTKRDDQSMTQTEDDDTVAADLLRNMMVDDDRGAETEVSELDYVTDDHESAVVAPTRT